MIMANKLKERLPKISMFLGVALFLLSSFAFFEEGKNLYGLIFLLIGILNFVVARKNPATSNRAVQLVTLLNIIGASLVALDYQRAGTQGIHLAWWVAALMYTATLVLSVWKSNKATPQSDYE